MATVEEIRAQIAAEQAKLVQEEQREANLEAQKGEAIERQRLRRQLDEIRSLVQSKQIGNDSRQRINSWIDADEWGPHQPKGALAIVDSAKEQNEVPPVYHAVTSHASCTNDIIRREYFWKVEGMSWINHALQHSDEDFALNESPFSVGDEEFDFAYHPSRGEITATEMHDHYTYCASLAIRIWEWSGATFRYKISIQRNDGEFVQWGPQGDEFDISQDLRTKIFGPDVQLNKGPATGIFGLTHEELLRSEWVHNDTLTVRFELEVRPRSFGDALPLKHVVLDVPAPALSCNLLSMLEQGKFSDITVFVKGEQLKAHSQVLAARSEVFEKQLQSGMRECVTKEIVVDDCEPGAFKAFLQFLYSDDFSHLETSMSKAGTAKVCDSTGGSLDANSKVSFLQEVLAISHKYQILRLSNWCEQKLCDLISEAEVCSILRQAHLCEAKVLEDTCLTFIKCNMQKVVPTSGFAHLSAEWPELLLKISIYGSEVSSRNAEKAVAAQQSLLRKRKHSSSSE
eukprot:TRINITY_DN29915_c0_g1_i1.p1 TRINITY_DN29915_c0_g1~~TRINITY_DN29915_c0_g1_i1.p1  ORF type:complete len:526 (+),score=107.39 TRINITY_DN29915_c0_g1_i1:41-1579(+)